jgi:hypothetical protein
VTPASYEALRGIASDAMTGGLLDATNIPRA